MSKLTFFQFWGQNSRFLARKYNYLILFKIKSFKKSFQFWRKNSKSRFQFFGQKCRLIFAASCLSLQVKKHLFYWIHKRIDWILFIFVWLLNCICIFKLGWWFFKIEIRDKHFSLNFKKKGDAKMQVATLERRTQNMRKMNSKITQKSDSSWNVTKMWPQCDHSVTRM